MNEDWREEIYNYIENKNLKSSYELFKRNLPKSFIKFFSGNEYSLESLKNDKIWMSSPYGFNDPFDSIIKIGDNSTIKEINEAIFNKEMSNEMMKKLTKKTKKIIKKTDKLILSEINKDRKTTFISCFTILDNLRNTVMWSHYANSHKGFCVEYRDINENYIMLHNGDVFFPVIYREEYSSFCAWLIERTASDLKKSSDGLDAKDFVQYCVDFFCIKSVDWKYEQEWRLILKNEDKFGEKGFLKDFNIPINVYIGCNAPESLKEELKEICKSKGIKLYQMKMKPNSFELIYEEVDTK